MWSVQQVVAVGVVVVPVQFTFRFLLFCSINRVVFWFLCLERQYHSAVNSDVAVNDAGVSSGRRQRRCPPRVVVGCGSAPHTIAGAE